jgi:hypothetical protein
MNRMPTGVIRKFSFRLNLSSLKKVIGFQRLGIAQFFLGAKDFFTNRIKRMLVIINQNIFQFNFLMCFGVPVDKGGDTAAMRPSLESCTL